MRNTQNKLMDSMNGLGGFLENLSRGVRANHEAIEENRRAIEDIREELTLLRQALAENSQLLADVADHLQVPRRRIGFNPE